MSSANDLVIRIDNINQLFHAPDVDPFSDKPAVLLGEPALALRVRQELGKGLNDWKSRRMVIQLPADQVNCDLEEQVVEAIRRYAVARRADNQAVIRISRWRSLVGLVFAIIIAAVLMAVLLIVSSTLLASASDAVLTAVAGIVTIFIWATVWNPWDRLVYEWIQPWLENRILGSIATMEIVVQAEPGPA